MFLGSEGILEFLARRAAIDILLRQIDEVLLAKATFRLRARGHRLGQRHGDPSAIASQDLNSVEVATIGDGIEPVGLQNDLRLLILALVTASQIASASTASFLCRFT